VGDNNTDLKISVMADVGRCNYKQDIVERSNSAIDLIRVATYLTTIPTAVDMIEDAHKKGYETSCNIMAISNGRESDIKAAVNQGIVAFMGHGNPEGYDYYGGNIRYLQLENHLRALNSNYYVGTVDMDETYAEDVLKHIAGGTFDYQVGDVTKTITYTANPAKKAQLYPLMSIAGDHAHNDMADEEDKESWVSLFKAAGIATTAYETTFTAACMKGYQTGTGYIPALAERSAVRALWMNHTREAIQKLGTEDALSTPTTAPDEE
jgi:sirohydrochlorin cobaltochelatase